MKKTIPAALTLLICLAGCDKTINEVLESFRGGNNNPESEHQSAVKLNKEAKYYNDYLGIAYTVPKGSWLYYVSEDNLSESAGTITDDIAMDIEYGKYKDYAYANLWFMSFGNLEKSTQDNHLGFQLDAISLDGINDIAAYMKYFEPYMLEPTEGAEYKMTDSQQLTIKGKPFEMRDYLVTRKDDSFHIITFSCQAKQGYFLNMAVDYWPENTRAKQTIIDSITKAIEFY